MKYFLFLSLFLFLLSGGFSGDFADGYEEEYNEKNLYVRVCKMKTIVLIKILIQKFFIVVWFILLMIKLEMNYAK